MLAVALAVIPVCRLAASPPAQNHSVTNSAAKPVVRNAHLDELGSTPKKAADIHRVGKMSSQPWTEIVGWNQGRSAFVTAETAEPQFVLFSVKF